MEKRQILEEGAPGDMKGIVYSNSVSRMLPSQVTRFCAITMMKALLLAAGNRKEIVFDDSTSSKEQKNQTLKYLWHAKRAESSLLTYLVEGVVPDFIAPDLDKELKVLEEKKKLPERGPIIVLLDTSGSMNYNACVSVSRALVFECMRIAHEEKRMCYLILFGGKNQIKEYTLELNTHTGLNALLEFLEYNFNGCTDIDQPITRVIELITQETWAQADLLLVSDAGTLWLLAFTYG